MPAYLELSVTCNLEEGTLCRDDIRVHNPAFAIVSLNGDVALLTLEESARRRSRIDQILLG